MRTKKKERKSCCLVVLMPMEEEQTLDSYCHKNQTMPLLLLTKTLVHQKPVLLLMAFDGYSIQKKKMQKKLLVLIQIFVQDVVVVAGTELVGDVEEAAVLLNLLVCYHQ